MNTTLKYKYVIIEDEPLIRNNMIKKIRSLDLPLTLVGEASNGMDGILLIGRELPHIIITDIRMPQCDGLEVAQYAKSHYPDSKIIILSGYDEFSYAQKALQYGVSDYILKPIKVERLKASLQELLIAFDSKSRDLLSLCVDPHELTQVQLCQLIENYLKAHYKSEVSLGSMADSIGFSLEYLGKIFKKATGNSPSKYLAKLRINEARQLLTQHPELDIGKIGELVGYKDAFYFSRIFKSHTGLTPSEYRIQREK